MAIIKDPVPTFWRSKKRKPVLQVQWFDKGARCSCSQTNRRHARQMAYRMGFARVKLLWDNLSTAQRTTWQTFASTFTSVNKYGDTIWIGGWQWFCRYNCRLVSTGQSLILNAPANDTPSYTPSFNFGPPVGGSDWSVTLVPAPAANESLLIRRKINQPYSYSTSPLPLQYFVQVVNGDPNPVTLGFSSEINYNYKKFFSGILPLDQYGRSSGWEYNVQTSNP